VHTTLMTFYSFRCRGDKKKEKGKTKKRAGAAGGGGGGRRGKKMGRCFLASIEWEKEKGSEG